MDLKVTQGAVGRGRRPAVDVDVLPHPRPRTPALGFGVVAGLSALAATWLGLRVEATGTGSLRFLSFNLLLAWVPYLVTLAAVELEARRWGRWWSLVPLSALALLFLPNAPYLVTDLVHLRLRREAPLWADAGMLLAFSAAGWMLGLYSLRGWKRIVERRWGVLPAWGTVGAAVLLSGFGIYLGRVKRWNSWDLWRAPDRLLVDAAQQLGSTRTLEIAVGFAVLLLVSFLLLERPGRRAS